MGLGEGLGDTGRCGTEEDASVTGSRKEESRKESRTAKDKLKMSLGRLRCKSEGVRGEETYPQWATVTESFRASKKGVVAGVSRE
jgi:hypothetical protein